METTEMSEMSKFLALIKHDMSFESMTKEQSGELLKKILENIDNSD